MVTKCIEELEVERASIYFDTETIRILREKVPCKKRSTFVNRVVAEALAAMGTNKKGAKKKK